jgi:hypothetical protein
MAFAGDVAPPASAALHQFDLDFLQGVVERKRGLYSSATGWPVPAPMQKVSMSKRPATFFSILPSATFLSFT